MNSRYRVVIVGRIVVGCSAWYRLARLGWSEGCPIERPLPTAGSAWHAAGTVMRS